MLRLAWPLLDAFAAVTRSRASLVAENLALRQQLAILKSEPPQPLRSSLDRAYRIVLSRLWPDGRNALIVVHPDNSRSVAPTRISLVLAMESRSSVGGRTASFAR